MIDPSDRYQRLFEPDPCHHRMAECFQIDRRIGQRLVQVADLVQRLRHVIESLPGSRQRLAMLSQGRYSLRPIDGVLYFAAQRAEQRTVLQTHLAPQQIEPVDAVRSLMNRIETVVAIE